MRDAASPTELLLAWGRGETSAVEALMPLVYDELRRLARGYMRRERAEHTLQPTALVNEAFLRLIEIRRVEWQNRAHFFAIAARCMRRILVDAARARQALKRGGDYMRVDLDADLAVSDAPNLDLIALDRALQTLAAMDERRERVVELRFFAGLSIDETAQLLDVSPETVMRDWTVARAWLFQQLGPAAPEP